jgi:putative ABC transport system permease protein
MKSLRVLLKLIVAENARHRVRAAVALLGIAIAVSLVAWNLRGLGLARAQMVEAAQQQGRFDVAITPKDFRGAQLDPVLLKAVSQDDAVAEVDVAVKSRVRVIQPELPPMPGPFGGGATVIGTGATEAWGHMADGRWLGAAAGEAVISSTFADRAKLKSGDELVLAGMGAETPLHVVGIMTAVGPAPMPGVRMMPPPHMADVYVSSATAGEINGYTDRPSLVCLVLKDPAAAGAFARSYRDRLAAAEPAAMIRALKDPGDDPMGGNSSGMQQMILGNITILSAFLAAVFIIFVTLSANVRERLRQYAILRALALSRGQIVLMIFMESMLLVLAGWGLGLGLTKGFLLLGQSLSGSVAAFQSSAFSDRPLGLMAVGLSGLAAFLGALAAAILPAWQASQIRPVDLLGGQGQGRTRRFPWIMVAMGLVLIAVNPVIVVMAGRSESVREVLSHLWGWGPAGFGAPLAGSLAMIVGFALVTPLAVLAAEKLFGPVLARLLRLDPRFLRQQLSLNLWRTVGTTVALSVGLSLFITSLVWGYSMLVPFTPTQGLPRMQVAIMPGGVPESAIAAVKATPGVKADECLPMAVEQPRLTDEMLQSPPFAHVDEQQQHLLFMGIDPQRAFGGDKPMFNLEFIEGDASAAARLLATGRYCVVPQQFATQTGLKVGDAFTVEAPNVRGSQVTYVIAGVASVPGWNWLSKFSETRRRAGRALAMVFVGYDQARTDFALDRVNYFWLNVDDGVTAKDLETRLEPLAKANTGVQLNVPQVGQTTVGSQYVKVTDREEVITMLFRRADDVIWTLTWLPLITLVITSLAVFNTILASVRARFWQIGVLRGVGLTRSQLLRLILGESLLICGAACLLSLASGIGLAWCGTRLCTLFFFFGGNTPPLVLPWAGLSLGLGLAVGLCLLAGLIPAAVAAMKEPLKFIQGGRLAA